MSEKENPKADKRNRWKNHPWVSPIITGRSPYVQLTAQPAVYLHEGGKAGSPIKLSTRGLESLW